MSLPWHHHVSSSLEKSLSAIKHSTDIALRTTVWIERGSGRCFGKYPMRGWVNDEKTREQKWKCLKWLSKNRDSKKISLKERKSRVGTATQVKGRNIRMQKQRNPSTLWGRKRTFAVLKCALNTGVWHKNRGLKDWWEPHTLESQWGVCTSLSSRGTARQLRRRLAALHSHFIKTTSVSR